MQKFENAVIIGASDVTNVSYQKKEGDFVIAADLGYKNALAMNIYPDIVLGDFDSLKSVPRHNSVITLPCEKDDTDTGYAVKLALENGAKRIFILGGQGGRLDHTFANIELLSYIAKSGALGYLFNNGEVLTTLKNQKTIIHGKPGMLCSVFSLSDKAHGVYERGFKYTLSNFALERSFPLGVSNELAGESAELEVKNGELLVIAQNASCDFINKNRYSAACVNDLLNILLT